MKYSTFVQKTFDRHVEQGDLLVFLAANMQAFHDRIHGSRFDQEILREDLADMRDVILLANEMFVLKRRETRT